MGFKPIKVIDLELTEPLYDVRAGAYYGAVRAPVRLRGVPPGSIELPLDDGAVSARVVARLDLGSEAREVYAGDPWRLGFGHGASMVARRERLEALGGFDEALGVGGPLRSWEDRDLGHRILHAGGRIVYTPRALTYHQQGQRPAEIYAAFYNYGIGAGATAAKYLRCGDPVGAAILGDWLAGQGLRQALSGRVKWRCGPKTAVGLQQPAVTWQGLALGLRYRVDRARRLYLAPGSALAQRTT